jgi:hypothetical protein
MVAEDSDQRLTPTMVDGKFLAKFQGCNWRKKARPVQHWSG